MYRIVPIFFILISCAAQMTEIPKDQVDYQRVIDIPLSKKEIYTNTLTWMAESFRSSQDVVQYKSLEEGKIIGNAIVKVDFSNTSFALPRNVRINIVIEMRDNRLRFTAQNIMLAEDYFGNIHLEEGPVRYAEQVEKIHPVIDDLVEDYKRYLTAQNSDSKW